MKNEKENKKFDLINFINECDPETKKRDLRMHKMLYFVYGFYYAATKNKELFEPNFNADYYGPVEIDYRNFFLHKLDERNKDGKKNCEYNIDKFYIENENLTLNTGWKTTTKDLIKFIIEHFLKNKRNWLLVKFSHNTVPWIETELGKKINKEEMNNFFRESLMFIYDGFFEDIQ